MMQRPVIVRRTRHFPGGRICVWGGHFSTTILLECFDPNFELNPVARSEIRDEWNLVVGQNMHGYAFHESDAAMFLELPNNNLDGLRGLLTDFCQRLVSPRKRVKTEAQKWLH